MNDGLYQQIIKNYTYTQQQQLLPTIQPLDINPKVPARAQSNTDIEKHIYKELQRRNWVADWTRARNQSLLPPRIGLQRDSASSGASSLPPYRRVIVFLVRLIENSSAGLLEKRRTEPPKQVQGLDITRVGH